jgi:hypothetical protein
MTEIDTSDLTALAAGFDHHKQAQADDPYPIYKAMREGCPVAHSEQHDGFWVVTSYEGVDTIVHHPEVFSSRQTSIPWGTFGEFFVLPPITLDPPEHKAFRNIVMPVFSPRAVAKWEGLIRDTCRSLIDSIRGRTEVDAAREYAFRIPVIVICALIGIPPEDEEKFASWIHRTIHNSVVNPPESLNAAGEMAAYFHAAVEDHKRNPRGDLLDTLINAESDDGRRLTDIELLGFLFLMITAGMDTTWSVIGDSIRHLGVNPEDRRRLVAAPEIMGTAVEEFLRLYTPALLGRVTNSDTELEGVTIPRGDPVLISFASANRDAKVFADPDRAVLDRTANRHLAFGAGIHRCLGAALARQEVRTALEEWLAAFPDYELVDPALVTYNLGQVRGPKLLPIRLPSA